jgi:hypothetical protein
MNTPVAHSDGAMTTFEGEHSHALTNTLFHYTARWIDHGDSVDWTASVRLGDKNVDEFHGSASRVGAPPGTDPTTLVMNSVRQFIDAKDYGQAPNRF